jgi:hypothetical protein
VTELSGVIWVPRFPQSTSTTDLTPPFEAATDRFLSALRTAGATVHISCTYRPPERAYLMHWAWMIGREETDAKVVPPHVGVDINWDHGDPATSLAAARAMDVAYASVTRPVLVSRHTQRRAIDVTIGWVGNLTIAKADGSEATVETPPRNGMNPALGAVGKGYGVIKATFSGDPPHWSDDGH